VIQGYWLFAALCLVIALFMFTLIVKERVTLQASLSFLLVLLLSAGMSLVPEAGVFVGRALGFSLVSNFFLACGVGALAFLHLASLIHLSRVQLRSVTLTQELALLQERLDRMSVEMERLRPRAEQAS
jgi:hypothetical protein